MFVLHVNASLPEFRTARIALRDHRKSKIF